MKNTTFLKRIWREILRIEEDKEAFFHGCKELINSTHYDRLFRDFRSRGELLYYSTEKKLLYLHTKDNITLKTDYYYDIFLEIFCNNIYMLPPQIEKNPFVVFDVGMNRGYASLFFANKENCAQVYGFELVKSTYKYATDNFSLNPHLSEKITSFNYGLWNEDSEIEIGVDNCDGHTSIKDVQQNISNKTSQKAITKKSSIVFSDLFEKIDKKSNKVLKIDVGGSEYSIFEDLSKNNLIDHFDVIIGEYHNGIKGLLPYLTSFVCSYKEDSVNGSGTMVFINKKCDF